jgi:glycosyltransferase involved in cell wall biosynthesis
MELKSYLQSLGWSSANGKFWETLGKSRPRIAFLAPPLDTIPSPTGNAIYCLMERLVERLGGSAMAMAIAPRSGVKETSISDRLLYYSPSLKPSWVLRSLPYRVKKLVFGTGAPEMRKYGRSAGAALRALKVRGVVVEDVPVLVSALARRSGPELKKVLHQHSNAPLGTSPRHWRGVCRALEGIAFVAQKTQKAALQRHGESGTPSRVIYNGVDLEHYSPAKFTSPALELRNQLHIAADSSVLLFAGRLLPGKGVAESAEAFNRASAGNSRMLVVGDMQIQSYRDEAYLSRLKEAVANSAGRITLAGTVSQAELPKWYAASDAVIVPSLGEEGLPKIITEALAMGKPVLASDRGGAWELLREGENGWLIKNPADPESTAQLIKSVLSDREALLHLSHRILERDRPLMSEEHMVKKFSDLLAEWCGSEEPAC